MTSSQNHSQNWFQTESNQKFSMTMFQVTPDQQYFTYDDMEIPNIKPKRNPQKSKINAKKYRENKKHECKMQRSKLQELEQENNWLKKQKYCRWCRRSFTRSIMCDSKCWLMIDETMEVEEKGKKEFCFETMKSNEEGKSKVWMALGILFLVLGVQLHGLSGCSSQEIIVSKHESMKWLKQHQSRLSDQPFKVKFKSHKIPSEKQNKKEMDFENKKPDHAKREDNFYNAEQSHLFYQQGKKDDMQFPKLHFSEDNAKPYEEISFAKDFIFALQAEIDDIGAYV